MREAVKPGNCIDGRDEIAKGGGRGHGDRDVDGVAGAVHALQVMESPVTYWAMLSSRLSRVVAERGRGAAGLVNGLCGGQAPGPRGRWNWR